MISSAFLYLASYVVQTIILIFPSSNGLPAEATTAIGTLTGYVGMFDPLIPIPTIATILGLVIAFELAVFAFKGLKWLLSHVPLVGGRG